jgi:hypothetical protein
VPEPVRAESDSGEQWQFHLAPYAWLAGQEGTVATVPPLPPVDIGVDFWDDVFGNTNGALFLVGDARKGRFGGHLDIAYVDIELDNETPGPLFTYLSSRTKSWIVSATGTYRVLDKPRSFLDLMAGIRYWSVDSSLALRTRLLPEVEVANKENWVDPIVGFQSLFYLGNSRFYMDGGLLIGGFGAGSDFMWDANLNLGYQWTETFSTTLGYRYLDVDYEKDDFLYDVALHGPELSLTWRW